MNAKRTSYHWMWLSITLMVILFIAFLLPLIPNDYWWFVRLGNDILKDGNVPTTDAYSYTRFGAPVVYQSWGGAVLFGLTYESGGISLTFLLRALLLGITYTILWKTVLASGVGPKLASFLTLSAALSGSNNWSHRPQLFAYVLFAWALFLLVQWHQGEDKKIWWLVLISLLWTNLHGSFVLLFPLAGAALIFGKGNRKTLLLALGLAGLVTLINPRGWILWKDVLETFLSTGSRNMSVEWGPPVNAGWQMGIFFFWILIFAPLTALSARRLPVLYWIWFLGFGWLALTGMRYVIWFLFILVPLTAELARDWDARWLDRTAASGIPVMNTALGVIFLLIPLIALPGIRESWWQDAPNPLFAGTPVEAIDWLSEHEDLPGEMWTDIHFASYQIYALPSRRVWIDTRIQVVYPQSLFDEYRVIATGTENWQELLDSYNINLLLLSHGSQSGLITSLNASPAWCKLYEDHISIIYGRVEKVSNCIE